MFSSHQLDDDEDRKFWWFLAVVRMSFFMLLKWVRKFLCYLSWKKKIYPLHSAAITQLQPTRDASIKIHKLRLLWSNPCWELWEIDDLSKFEDENFQWYQFYSYFHWSSIHWSLIHAWKMFSRKSLCPLLASLAVWKAQRL